MQRRPLTRPLTRFVARFVAVLGGMAAFTTAITTSGAGAASTATFDQPVLTGRATLSADYLAEGPPSGADATPANGRQGPFAGQVIPGFSGLVDNGDGTFWALPDNGFGSKANSTDFLLRLYLVEPDWETASGGPGAIEIREYVQLADPDRLVPFEIVNEATAERLLTGGDFDIESVVKLTDGTFWIGEEFGPFLLHVDADGTVLAAPVELPGGRSPQNPNLASGEAPTIPQSRGFEAIAVSDDERFLYPIVEGAYIDDAQPRRRVIHEFDLDAVEYTGRTWSYETDQDANVIGDAFLRDDGRMLILERDNFDGAQAVTKRIYEVRLDDALDDDFLPKELVVDLLRIGNADGIGAGTGFGTGDPFSFPLVSVEVVLELADGRLVVANDNNYPGNAARVPGTPDDTEMILLDMTSAPMGSGQGPLVIGHRGASGERPEHTLAAYQQAISQCAAYIEPDLVPTKDGVLVARHENEIGGTTDVGDRPEFADRRTTKSIDGVEVTGWFTEDFTLAELKTLRAKERIPAIRSGNTYYDGLYQVPTFDEVVDLARHSRTCDGRPVGVYPETKHASYFDALGLSMEEGVVQVLEDNGYGEPGSPVFIQSFETANLRDLAGMTDLPLVQLVNCQGQPWDFAVQGDPRTYADLVTADGLDEIATYASGIGVCKNVLIPRDADGNLTQPSDVISMAHERELIVHGWTFRRENNFLPASLRSSADPAGVGDMVQEVDAFLAAGMDGFFTDNPLLGTIAVYT
jgi:glycerophosphoryl diester phosphodiesterase